ncbi:ATP-binding cassette sub-family D member 3-like [Spea bombifrons]|uniref:ATP-binding cassette sub-family D member 3-like n=1 Tax=Spea bombifrons TaxID=233779 RepID=UPI00234C01CE|nr:ATP-binding cassette sub-family D member 3-like [Spea bombifrons]
MLLRMSQALGRIALAGREMTRLAGDHMNLGTLRDQVIYPDTPEHWKRKGIPDKVLKEYLDNVQLGYILEREGGWDSV